MNTISPPPPGDAPVFTLAGLAESANEKLENTLNEAAHRAFNLGCLIGLLPAVIFAVAIFLATGFSFIGAAMAVVLGVISAIAFANLAAMITRSNTLNRAYRDDVLPEIEHNLHAAGIPRRDFDQAARQALPPTAPLYTFITPEAEPAPGLPTDDGDHRE